MKALALIALALALEGGFLLTLASAPGEAPQAGAVARAHPVEVAATPGAFAGAPGAR
jgi:hypothetical protein